jgi:hypothetical protein
MLLQQIGELLGLTVYEGTETWRSGRPVYQSNVSPPVDEMEILHRLAMMGICEKFVNGRACCSLDERHRSFADTLRQLAEGYQSEAILNMVEDFGKR